LQAHAEKLPGAEILAETRASGYAFSSDESDILATAAPYSTAAISA
jgi:hypothetical protein